MFSVTSVPASVMDQPLVLIVVPLSIALAPPAPRSKVPAP
jgi:hypothetical protein